MKKAAPQAALFLPRRRRLFRTALATTDPRVRIAVLLPHAQLLHHAVGALAGVLALPRLGLLLLLGALGRLVLVRGGPFLS